jgi:hypothetical protein
MQTHYVNIAKEVNERTGPLETFTISPYKNTERKYESYEVLQSLENISQASFRDIEKSHRRVRLGHLSRAHSPANVEGHEIDYDRQMNFLTPHKSSKMKKSTKLGDSSSGRKYS